MSLKKMNASITKNQETSGDDKFMKPPPDKTIGLKTGQYDKMNEKGYCAEETHLTNGDIVFGKVTPINDTSNSGKIFKDSSEQYKHHADAVVDRVYTGIKNQDGFETRKALIRSERIPRIGDKFCIPDSVDVDVLTSAGWKSLKQITKNDLVATLDNGVLKYDNPIDIYEFKYDGQIYKVRSQQVDIDVTIDHELYVKRNNQKSYKLVPAIRLFGTKYKMKKNGINTNSNYECNLDELMSNINEHNKFPDYVWLLSQTQTRKLLEMIVKENYHITDSTIFADELMRLVIHSGWNGSIIENNEDKLQLAIKKDNNEPIINTDEQELYDYSGTVRCIEVPSHVFMIRQNNKNVWIGNCSRHGQKGTMGNGLDGVDMPFTINGMRPDIIVNPNAIPSRMTIGQLWECLLGKIGALSGMNMDGTAFEDYSLEKLGDMLEKLGYKRTCVEVMTNGMTGKKLQSEIFIGPTFYQRLKHQVEDKIHARARGPVTVLTHQASEGF